MNKKNVKNNLVGKIGTLLVAGSLAFGTYGCNSSSYVDYDNSKIHVSEVNDGTHYVLREGGENLTIKYDSLGKIDTTYLSSKFSHEKSYFENWTKKDCENFMKAYNNQIKNK